MFDLSIEWLTIIVNASVRALFIATIAFAALRLFKLRDSNIRHRVWSGVLAGMLCLPILSGLLPPVLLPFQLQTDWLLALEESSATSQDTQPAVMEPISNADVPLQKMGPFGAESIPESQVGANGPLLSVPKGHVALQTPISDASETDQPVPAEKPAASVASGFASREVRTALTVAFGAWLFGMAMFLFRTIIGLLATTGLLRRSNNLQNQLPSACSATVLKAFQNGRIRLMCSDEIRVPVTVGWWKPTVLLPTAWQDWSTSKLDAVLAHEATHVVRRDFIVAVLAEVNRCLYWFHPMSWWLRRKLSDLAEEACDDAAIDLTGNPAGYARHLLEVATALAHGRGRIVQPGLSMARQSNVETRITTILDFTRPLSRQLTWKALAVLLLVTVPVIALSAALQPAGPKVDEQSVSAENVDEQTTADATPKQAENPKGLRIHGQVVNEKQQAIPSAKVQLFHSMKNGFYAGEINSTLIEELDVDEEGRFDATVSLNKLPQDTAAKHRLEQGWVVLVITAPEHRCDTHTFQDYDEADAINVQLVPDVPIVGTLLSLEGRPVEGVDVRVFAVHRADSKEVDEWLVRVGKSSTSSLQARELAMMAPSGGRDDRFPQGRDLRLSGEAAPIATTDENGRFQLNGFGKDDLVIVDFSGSGIAKSTVHVLGRETKTVYGGHRSNLSDFGSYYGRTFKFVTRPSAPVFGVVRDIESKEPLANVTVAVGGIAGRTFSHTGYVVTSTDHQGRYRIDGLPTVQLGASWRDRNRLSVRPGRLPYIENDGISVPSRGGLKPVEFDIELRKAVMARGRLTDIRTGEPVTATIFYSPFRTNEHGADYSRFADDTTMMLGNDSRYKTDEDGNFFVPVIPGRGVIAAKATSGTFCTQYGIKDIPEFEGGEIENRNTVTSDHIVPSLYHSLKAVDVPTDVDEINVDMQVDPGMSLTAKFIDPDGKPLKNVEVSGAPGYRGWVKTETDSTTISSLVVGQVRPIWATHAGPNRISRMIQLTPEEGQTEFTIQLFERTVVTGRLIDVDGNPIANQSLEARHSNDPEFINTVHPNQTTDADGSFQYYLVVGTTYRIIGQTSKYFTVVKDLEATKPQRIDLGDLVVDPDADNWAQVEAKREPIVKDREPYKAQNAE